jgi:hypothetical protein
MFRRFKVGVVRGGAVNGIGVLGADMLTRPPQFGQNIASPANGRLQCGHR